MEYTYENRKLKSMMMKWLKVLERVLFLSDCIFKLAFISAQTRGIGLNIN